MKPQGGWRGVLFPAVLTVCLLLSLAAGGIYFAGYLQAQIFAERSTQLNEITYNKNHPERGGFYYVSFL